MKYSAVLTIFPFLIFQYASGEEVICTVNTKRAINKVSDKFLSVSIDPAVLLTGLNLSDKSLQLAKHLSPAYIRVAGPSTQFVKYAVNDDRYRQQNNAEPAASVEVTPSMWFGINEWLALANLTPVFGINDAATAKGVWNPKTTLPLLELSDKLNVSSLWQLGFDCSNKTELHYKGDLVVLRQILNAFPSKKDIWRVVASDLSRCPSADNAEAIRETLDDLQDVVQAAMWEPATADEYDFPNIDVMSKLLASSNKPPVDIWTTAPKPVKSASFATAIIWMKQMSEAAKQGYAVIFRQFRLHEMFSESPAYWASLVFKTLMGRNVLEVKTTETASEIHVYAHCTRNQDDFSRRGAMTVLIINNSTEENSAQLRLGAATHMKSMEVQSYILTAPYEASPQVYLNDIKLTTSVFKGSRANFVPKLRRAKVNKYLTLSVPPKSISFFVIPGARNPVCVTEENELSQVLENIVHDQSLPPFEENKIMIESRVSSTQPTLRELQRAIQKELASDERYYHEHTTVSAKRYEEGSERYVRRPGKKNTEIRNYYTSEKPKDRPSYDRRVESKPKSIDIELTSAEIRKVLADRARARAAARNIVFTSEELQELMHKASQRFLDKPVSNSKPRRKFKRQIDPAHQLPSSNARERQIDRENRAQALVNHLNRSSSGQNRGISRIETLRNNLLSNIANIRGSTTTRPHISARIGTDTIPTINTSRLLPRLNIEPRVRPTLRPYERLQRLILRSNQDIIRRPIIDLRNNQGDARRMPIVRTRINPRINFAEIMNRQSSLSSRANQAQSNHGNNHELVHAENRLENAIHEAVNNNHVLPALQPNHQEGNLHSSALTNHQTHTPVKLHPDNNQHHPSQVNIHVNLHPHPGHPNANTRPGMHSYSQNPLHTIQQRQAAFRNPNVRVNDLQGPTRVSLQRHRRDINMDLLRLKTGGLHKTPRRLLQSRFRDRETKEATLRKSGETSDELLRDIEEEEKHNDYDSFPSGNVFAELASSSETKLSNEEENVDIFSDPFGMKHKPFVPRLFNKNRALMPPVAETKFLPVQSHTDLKRFTKFEGGATEGKNNRKSKKEIEVPEPLQFLTERDGFDSLLEHDEWNPYRIHEYMGTELKHDNAPKQNNFEFPTRGGFSGSLQNRGFSFLGHRRRNEDEFDLSRGFMKDTEYDDLDSDERPMRFKRSHGTATADDQIREETKRKSFRLKKLEIVPRKLRKERARKQIVTLSNRHKETGDTNTTQDVSSVNDIPLNKQSFHITVGDPKKAAEKKIDERAKDRQFAFLRSRLAHRKKMDEKKTIREEERVKQNVVTEGKHQLQKRSLELSNNIIKRYKPVGVSKKSWKPDDIRLLKNKSRFLTNVIKKEPMDDTAIFRSYLQGKKRPRRGVDTDIDIDGNKIDSNVNDIIKESDIPLQFRSGARYKANISLKGAAKLKHGGRVNAIKKDLYGSKTNLPEEMNDSSEFLSHIQPQQSITGPVNADISSKGPTTLDKGEYDNVYHAHNIEKEEVTTTDDVISDIETTTMKLEPLITQEFGYSLEENIKSTTEKEVNYTANLIHDTGTSIVISEPEIHQGLGHSDDVTQIYQPEPIQTDESSQNEPSLWHKVIAGVTDFFQKVGAKISSYFGHA